MKFKSTRDTSKNPALVSAAYAIKTGLAPDGGLYIPESVPALTKADFDALIPMTYEERAAKILSLYLTDYTCDELYADACAAYAPEKFGDYAAPLHAMSDGTYSLELWH
ncbi:MAG: threonine synthase, partial [Clostridia bacterium]|nr:threonine synthase [Clostridia bacterium]